ncbi:MAG: tetratricopeptide repeat protein, partial [Myxococcota bacterium]
GEEPDLEVALGIARGVGASYAVMGSAVDLGSGVRISAEVYDLSTGESIGRAGVEGSADSVLTLVDRLSIGVLQHVVALSPDELPRFDVREITTSSLEALRAYLAGEQRFRRGLWEEAVEDFTRALDEDSTFALAAIRNSQAYGWTEGFSRRVLEFSQQAERNADRLPPRAAMFIHAFAELLEQRRSSIEALEALTARYPDHVEARFALGEAYYHFGERAFFDAEKHRQAFRRALELDPSYSPAYIHLIEDAFARRDSAETRTLLDSYSALSPGGPHAIGFNLLSDLAWGEAAVRERAIEALDTVDAEALRNASTAAIREGAYPWEVSLLVSDALTDSRIDEGNRTRGHLGLSWNYLARGRLEESREPLRTFLVMRDYPPSIAEDAASMWLSVNGYPASAPQQLASKPDDFAHFVDAAYAADQGRFSVIEDEIAGYELRAEEAAAEGDEIGGLAYGSFAQALSAYSALRRGDLPLAVAEYQKPMPRLPVWASGLLRFSIGKALLEDGDAAEAEKYLKSVAPFYVGNVPSQYYLGETYEALGEPERARLHYASFVRWWEEADPELQPWVERARDALERLTRENRSD